MTRPVPYRLRRRLHARVVAKSGRRNTIGGTYQALRDEPGGLTYVQLAERVYATTTPTAAQTSAVRRAVAELATYGLVQRQRPGAHVIVTRTDQAAR